MQQLLFQEHLSLPRAGGRLLLGLACLLALSQCRKADANPQLPPETTTGANTFGCKIDGKVFLPRDKMGKAGFTMAYPDIVTGHRHGHSLDLMAFDWQTESIDGVQLGTDSLLVEQGKTYQLKTSNSNAQAAVFLKDAQYLKLNQDPGELTITHFDSTQNIVSGHFNFVATDPITGKQVHVTDGRFDVNF